MDPQEAPSSSAKPPWRKIVVASALGTLAVTGLVGLDVTTRKAGVVELLRPGADGPSREAIRRDFPGQELTPGLGHDGQQYYAIARTPTDPQEIARHLDRPLYRLQRPLYPWLSALLVRRSGEPLVIAMFVIGVLSIFGGAVATGFVAARLGATPLLALAFPMLPGAFFSLRISTPDNLSLALGLGALACLIDRRRGWAVLLAILSGLSKESALALFAGVALWRRDRSSLVVLAASAATIAAWWAALRLIVPVPATQVMELTHPDILNLPGTGFVRSMRSWIAGDYLLGATSLLAVLLGVFALIRRGRAGLGWPIVAQIGLLSILSYDALCPNANGTRNAMTLLLLSLIHLLRTRRHDAVTASI